MLKEAREPRDHLWGIRVEEFDQIAIEVRNSWYNDIVGFLINCTMKA